VTCIRLIHEKNTFISVINIAYKHTLINRLINDDFFSFIKMTENEWIVVYSMMKLQKANKLFVHSLNQIYLQEKSILYLSYSSAQEDTILCSESNKPSWLDSHIPISQLLLIHIQNSHFLHPLIEKGEGSDYSPGCIVKVTEKSVYVNLILSLFVIVIPR
jgi:hypothetical protein